MATAKKTGAVVTMLFRNRNPAGHLFNMLFGLAEIADAIVRIATLGRIATEFPITVSRWQITRHLQQLKRAR